ncbi:ArsR/SmtB family transcription factor [Pelagibacterium xiamenense]|uniref:ArsR/SmtB family transcription factor n=1 Tax=Pelagibacterium xiamenense TaxID=2901140 RepID=UPI001E379612|nr:metalloregulator ArsR/SmtB family transcription factor [Pelagibacterium xiamenense]MCD7060890.1 metalloregulator ArsR/SmtB family transcription factor [Pelagibacterium xiamenense]
MDIFAVIADPTRRAMLDMMRQGEYPAGAFVAAFPNVSQPAISQHLKVLRDAGLVAVRADKQRRFYTLKAEGLASVVDWVLRYRPSPPALPEAAKPPDERPVPKAPRAKPKPEAERTLDLFG